MKKLFILSMNIERLSKMIQELSHADFAIVSGIVERLSTKNSSFDFPLDDEPTTIEDLEDIKIATSSLNRDEWISFTDVENELRN